MEAEHHHKQTKHTETELTDGKMHDGTKVEIRHRRLSFIPVIRYDKLITFVEMPPHMLPLSCHIM